MIYRGFRRADVERRCQMAGPDLAPAERIEHAQERLERGFMVCDALYAFCRQTREAAREV